MKYWYYCYIHGGRFGSGTFYASDVISSLEVLFPLSKAEEVAKNMNPSYECIIYSCEISQEDYQKKGGK